jgi:hypothetical protein
MAGLALASLLYNFNAMEATSIGLINCFRIAKVPRSQQGHDKAKINIVLGEIENSHKARKKKKLNKNSDKSYK